MKLLALFVVYVLTLSIFENGASGAPAEIKDVGVYDDMQSCIEEAQRLVEEGNGDVYATCHLEPGTLS